MARGSVGGGKTIHKYPISISDFTLSMPRGAEILTLQVQRGVPYIWALVDRYTYEYEPRQFGVVGTGQLMEGHTSSLGYVGTWQELCGDLVWHLWEYL
jgi:hypothetical protein